MEVNEQKVSMQVTRDALARLDYVQYFEEEPDVTEVYLRISPKITFAQDGKMMLAINNVLNKNLVFDKFNDSTALLALTKAQWNDLYLQDWQIYYADAMQKIPLSIKNKVYDIDRKHSINRRCFHIENQSKLLALQPFPTAKNIKYNEQYKVVELDFSGKRLNTLPDEIACFSYLKNLYFFISKLDFLPEKLGDVSTLERLDLAFQSESFTLPNSFSQLKNLVWLDMRGFPAKSLPEDFGNLTALKELNLSNAKLESLPSSIANLFQLKELYLNSNNLRDIPKEICQLSALVTLEMSQNKNIQEIPLCLTQLEQLITLKINDASIVNMPKGFAPNMKKLQYLHLNYNKLHALPDDFIKFPKLYNLYLRHNNFSEEDKIYYNNLAEDTSIGISF
jgi:Leucine-rich repeat (LRR) protein